MIDIVSYSKARDIHGVKDLAIALAEEMEDLSLMSFGDAFEYVVKNGVSKSLILIEEGRKLWESE